MDRKDHGTLAAYLDLFMHRKFLFLAVFGALFALLGLGAMTVKTSYRATSLLAIGETEQLGLYQPMVGGRAKPPTASAGLSGKTYATIVKGLPMAEAIASRLSSDTLTVDPRFIHRSIRAEFYEPEVLEITATARNPRQAVVIANAAAEAFIVDNRDRIRGEMQEAADFVVNELKVVERELALIQSEIGDFKRLEQVTDLDVEVKEQLGAVTTFEKDRSLTTADLAEHRARYEELRRRLFEELSVEISPLEDPGTRGLVQRLGELEVELERAKSEYGPEHPKRALLERQVQTTREMLESATSSEANGTRTLASDGYYGALRNELTATGIRIIGLEARIRALDAAIAGGRSTLAALPPKAFELQRLQLRASITEDKYRRLLERLEAMEVEIEAMQGNASVLDLASAARPTLSRALLLVYVAVLSMLGAIGIVLTMEYRDNTIKSGDVITNVLRMTNFGFVPRIRNMDRRFLEEGTDEHAFEHYRKLRANVRFSSVKRPIHCLVITSAGPGEGKSSTVVNLGLALTQMDQRVLLVDTDLRRPSLARILEMKGTPGVTDVLTGEQRLDAVIQDSGFPNLHFLPSGPIPPNPAELFESDRMSTLISELRANKSYDIILFDSAPTLLTTDTPVLAAQMDGVLVVLESGKTTEEQALATKEMLVNAGARVIGAVLNKARSAATNGYYYYGYGRQRKRKPREASNDRGILGTLKNLGQRIRPGA